MSRHLNGTVRFERKEQDLISPNDKILHFIKTNTDSIEYLERFDRIYAAYRWNDWERYCQELRDWMREIKEKQAENDKRGKNEVIRVNTGMLSLSPK